MARPKSIGLGLKHPVLISEFVEDIANKSFHLATSGRWPQLIDFFYNKATGRSIYLPYLQWRHARDRWLQANVLGHTLLLNPDDPGISYDLLIHGMREESATSVLRTELRKLHEERTSNESIIAVEIGANIGYYALQEADLLGHRGHVLAFEPAPHNFRLLDANVALNDYRNRIDVEKIAIGNTNGTAQMYLPKRSNWATLNEVRGSGRNGEQIDVPIRTLDTYLDEAGINPSHVGVIRMDIEGYEAETLRGMQKTLSSVEHVVVFIEIHTRILREEDKLDTVINALQKANFDDFMALRRHNILDIENIADIANVPTGLEIFCKKGGKIDREAVGEIPG